MDVDCGSKEDASSLVERLIAEYFADELHQLRIPCRGERGRRWQAGRDLPPPSPSRTVGSVGDMHAL